MKKRNLLFMGLLTMGLASGCLLSGCSNQKEAETEAVVTEATEVVTEGVELESSVGETETETEEETQIAVENETTAITEQVTEVETEAPVVDPSKQEVISYGDIDYPAFAGEWVSFGDDMCVYLPVEYKESMSEDNLIVRRADPVGQIVITTEEGLSDYNEMLADASRNGATSEFKVNGLDVVEVTGSGTTLIYVHTEGCAYILDIDESIDSESVHTILASIQVAENIG